MLNNMRVTSVGKSDHTDVVIPRNLTIEEVVQVLSTHGLKLSLGKNLKGGVVSEVVEATLTDGTPVVVKHTTDWVSTNPATLTINKEGHNVDTQLLNYLAANSSVRVPKVISHLSDIPVTVMEDLRPAGFQLMSDLLLQKTLPDNCAENIGKDLAIMQQSLGKHPEFMTNESAWEMFYDRGQELRIVYPNDSSHYDRLEKRFTTQNQQLTAVDTHPKNMFVDAAGTMAWIDFGRSTWCDRDYALPNCLAHFIVYSLAGYISLDDCADFIRRCIQAYKQVLPVDEAIFCSYIALEILHRFAGKYIAGIDSADQKSKLLHFGLNLFNQNIDSIDSLLSALLAA